MTNIDLKTKTYQWFKFQDKVNYHIRNYCLSQYGDFPDENIKALTPEKIQAKLEAYVRRIGKGVRGKDEEIRDCLKIAHYACFLHFILTTGSAHPKAE